MSTSIDEVIVDTVYNSINPNVYENLSNFESSTQTAYQIKILSFNKFRSSIFKSNKSSIVLLMNQETKVSSKNYRNFIFQIYLDYHGYCL